jgi:dipeptidyl aminopeptidase/acylaminoacyl peptidase
MKKITILSVVFALFAGCGCPPTPSLETAADVPKLYDVHDFFSNPERAYYRLSDDGKTLGFMQPYENRMNVHVVELPSGGGAPDFAQARRLTGETNRDIAIYYWKGSQRILYVKDFGGDENFHVVSVDVASGAVTDLTPGEKIRAEIVDELRDDSEHILIQHNQRDPQVFDVFRVEVAAGKAELVAQNPGNITGWITDHDGLVRAAVTTDGVNNGLLYRDRESESFKTVLTTDFRTQVQPIEFTADNKKLYVISNRGRDKTALTVLDPADAQESAPLFEHAEVDIDTASFSDERKVLLCAHFQTWKSERHCFDPQITDIYAKLEAQLPGFEIILQSSDRKETKYIVAAVNDRTEGTRYVYDVSADKLGKLGDINPKINPTDMAPMKPVSYVTRDGLKINGYLTLPVGREPKNLPVVVNPHGGPWARDGWYFNPEVQFLANRGYAVFQMNYRGSTGYGRKFWEASFKQWGKAMQDDITDGVMWLIKEGVADPKRVGIYGGSYGGYATLAGVTFTPDLYAAAVDYVGVSNMFTFMNSIPPYWEPMRRQFYEMVGDIEKDKELLKAASPVFHADRIKTPVLIAQGANDPRVNKAESDQMVEALKKRGIDVEYLVKDNEGHGFRNEENQFEFYGAMERFFAKYLEPK